MQHLRNTAMRTALFALQRTPFHGGRFATDAQQPPAQTAPAAQPEAATPKPATQQAKIKLTVKHRGVETNADDPKLNLMAYADLPQFNDPKRSQFPIPEKLPAALAQVGYVTPTPIQQHTIPMMLLGEDIIGLAPTGTGKTLAFAVPALTRIDPNVHSCQVLVICPTRELAMQTYNVFAKLAGPLGIRAASAYGGQQNRNFQSRQCHGAHIIIATPGRLCDFGREGVIDLSRCQFFVLDEADRLLDMGFKPQIDDIMHFFRSNQLVPQTLMWSATWDDKIQNLAREYIKANHFLVSTGAHETGHSVNPLIKQICHFTEGNRPPKIQILMDLYRDKVISTSEKAILFVERKQTAANVFAMIAQNFQGAFGVGYGFCRAVHGDLPQRERERAIYDFKEGHCNLLVATDVVARGIDIPNVSHVINYEMPSQFDSYVHRIGRTGRNGNTGNSHAFFDAVTDVALAPSLEKFLKASEQPVPEKLVPYVEQGKRQQQQKYEKKFGRRNYGGGGRGQYGGYQDRSGGYRSGGHYGHQQQRGNYHQGHQQGGYQQGH